MKTIITIMIVLALAATASSSASAQVLLEELIREAHTNIPVPVAR